MQYRLIDGYEFEAGTLIKICTAIRKSIKFRFRSSLQEWRDSGAVVLKRPAEPLSIDTPGHQVEEMIKMRSFRKT